MLGHLSVSQPRKSSFSAQFTLYKLEFSNMLSKLIALSVPSLLIMMKVPMLHFQQSSNAQTTTNQTSSDWQYLQNIWSNERYTLNLKKGSNLTKFRSVNALKVAFRQKSIESLAADDLPNSPFDHIGERIEPNEDGSCPPRYVINKKRTYW